MGDGVRGGSGSSGGGGGPNRPAWLQQYELIGKIGEGTYGLVFLAKSKQAANRGKCIAIKKFKQSKDGDGVSPTAIREIMVCAQRSTPSFGGSLFFNFLLLNPGEGRSPWTRYSRELLLTPSVEHTFWHVWERVFHW